MKLPADLDRELRSTLAAQGRAFCAGARYLLGTPADKIQAMVLKKQYRRRYQMGTSQELEQWAAGFRFAQKMIKRSRSRE